MKHITGFLAKNNKPFISGTIEDYMHWQESGAAGHDYYLHENGVLLFPSFVTWPVIGKPFHYSERQAPDGQLLEQRLEFPSLYRYLAAFSCGDVSISTCVRLEDYLSRLQLNSMRFLRVNDVPFNLIGVPDRASRILNLVQLYKLDEKGYISLANRFAYFD
jgi:hypothetical protein